MSDRGSADVILRAEGIEKSFVTGGRELKVLLGADLEVKKGEISVIVGQSGVGKSTLLHILGTLERPTRGSVFHDGKNVFLMSDDELSGFRNREIGFVFQFHHLLPEFDAGENLMIPALIAGKTKKEAMDKAAELMADVGLSDRLKHRPGELSIGEQQRVAVARALVNSPKIVFADEPTGSLDRASALEIHGLIRDLASKKGQTFVVVTHNEELVTIGDRVSRLSGGGLFTVENAAAIKNGVK